MGGCFRRGPVSIGYGVEEKTGFEEVSAQSLEPGGKGDLIPAYTTDLVLFFLKPLLLQGLGELFGNTIG